MLMYLMEYLKEYNHAFGVFNYVTLRMVLATLTSLLVGMLMGPYVIERLQKMQIGQVVRNDGPSSHFSKKGTPTMGGALILLSISITVLIWGRLENMYLQILTIATLGFGLIGWVDDYRKIVKKNSVGLPGRWKYFWQSILAVAVAGTLYFTLKDLAPIYTSLQVPFFKKVIIPLGVISILFSYFVIVGTSNAVNLTDGLDGLAIMPVVMVAGALGVFAYAMGNANHAAYLQIPYLAGVEELGVFCAAIVGSGLGFLWFNTYPAQIFMGDVGSLALGAALGIIAVMLHQELVLFIMGGVFVAETLSVILQVSSYKIRSKRIFKMAPLHHHYELMGWPEPKIIVRFWIITVILVLCGLATLKLR